MRAIKFRVWKDGKMSQPFDLDDYAVDQDSEFGGRNYSLREGVILMQFTGLLDKNGKEIYDGDIISGSTQRFTSIRYIGNNPESRDFKGVIEFEGGCFSIVFKEQRVINRFGGSFRLFFKQGESYEILGNIYEHPELILVQETTQDA